MNLRMFACALSYVLSIWLVGVATPTIAQEAIASNDSAAILAPFVNDDTFSAGYLRLTEASDVEQLRKLLLQVPQQSPQVTLVVNAIAQAIGGLQSAGATGAYFVIGLGDVHFNCGPLVIVHARNGADQNSLENMFRAIAQSLETRPGMPSFPVERHGPDVFMIGSAATIARYKAIEASPRGDLLEPLTKLAADGATVATVFSPGADFRRVVRELWPTFPEPLAAWKRELADRWLRLDFAADLSASTAPSVRLVLQATDSASADLFAQLLRALPEASQQLPGDGKEKQHAQQVLKTILLAVSPEVDGAQVVLRLPTDEEGIGQLQGLLGKAADAALESNRRQERMKQFKQMALAMYMYADKYKHLPPPAIRDASGKPLLSWRVAILPFLGQNELYKKFNLDEPWDSPHNLPWSKLAVETFSDPAHPELTRAGKTTYVVPVGPGTIFDSDTGLALREVKDGLSHTVMIVEVPPENAVIWTKPDDWEVDMANPLKGLIGKDQDHITSAWGDGHAELIPANVKPDRLKAYLSRAGGETVDQP